MKNRCLSTAALVPLFVFLFLSIARGEGNIPGDPWGLVAEDIYAQPVIQGHTTYDPNPPETFGTYTVTADGHDIWDTADDFRYLYLQASGDLSVSVCILENPFRGGTDGWSKASVMVRQDNSPGSPEVSQIVPREYGRGFQWRDSQNGDSSWSGRFDPVRRYPHWIRIRREGHTFYGDYSFDGKAWEHHSAAEHVLVMTDPVLIGICLTSRQSGILTTVRFTDLRVNGLGPGRALPEEQSVYGGETVTLDGSGFPAADSFHWEQVIEGDEPIVALDNANPPDGIAHFTAPSPLRVGVVLTFRLTVTGATGTHSEETRVTVRATSAPTIAPDNLRVQPTDDGFWLFWGRVFDAEDYLVWVEVAPGLWFPVGMVAAPQFEFKGLMPGRSYQVKIQGRNKYGPGAESDPITYRIIARSTIFADDFDSYTNLYVPDDVMAAGWTIVNGSGDAAAQWRLWDTHADPLGQQDPNLAGMDDQYMIADSDLSTDANMDEELITPEINCTEWLGVRLDFNKNFRPYLEDVHHLQIGEVDIRSYDEASGWSDWIHLLHFDRTMVSPGADPADDSAPEQVDLSSHADRKRIQIRWHLYDARYDWWFAVDDIVVSGMRVGPQPPSNAIIVKSNIEVPYELRMLPDGEYTSGTTQPTDEHKVFEEVHDNVMPGNWQITWLPLPNAWPKRPLTETKALQEGKTIEFAKDYIVNMPRDVYQLVVEPINYATGIFSVRVRIKNTTGPDNPPGRTFTVPIFLVVRDILFTAAGPNSEGRLWNPHGITSVEYPHAGDYYYRDVSHWAPLDPGEVSPEAVLEFYIKDRNPNFVPQIEVWANDPVVAAQPPFSVRRMVSHAAATISLQWNCGAGSAYLVEAADSAMGPWVAISNEISSGAGTVEWADFPPEHVRCRFYRIRALSP